MRWIIMQERGPDRVYWNRDRVPAPGWEHQSARATQYPSEARTKAIIRMYELSSGTRPVHAGGV